MSASTIARWNAIPLTRQDDSLKRPRPEDEDHYVANGGGDDDDVSLVSRSPSPAPMDVDESISKYDEYHRGAEREVITVNTRIKPTNKGFAMLAKLGWVEGQPLGLSGDGRVDPIPFYVKNDLTGLGKTSQDVRMIETTVAQRRGLDSERQQKETEEQRRAREENVARRTALQSEISTTLRPFYCVLCDKQFKTVTQYDEHTNSYAHHHKARSKDMQANARLVPKEEVDKRKEKERKREEKELRKIAAANGIRMPKPAVGSIAPLVSPTPVIVEPTASDDPPRNPGGWASVSTPSSSGFKRSGWATVGGSATPPPPPSNDPPPPPSPPPPSRAVPSPPQPSASSSSGGWQNASSPLPPLPPSPPPAAPKHAPVFRTGGWTSLSSDSQVAPPQPMPSSWHSQPRQLSPPRGVTPQTSSLSSAPSSIPAAQPVRSGWQQFKHAGPKRR